MDDEILDEKVEENNSEEVEAENEAAPETKKTNWLLPIIGIAIVVIGVFWMSGKSKNEEVAEAKKPVQQTVTSAVVPQSGLITVEGGMFYFKPNEIKVKKNQLVKLTFTNKEGMHDFVLDKFNVKTKRINAGESETIEFTPNEAGEFEFYCSVGSHRAQGMFGKIIVEE